MNVRTLDPCFAARGVLSLAVLALAVLASVTASGQDLSLVAAAGQTLPSGDRVTSLSDRFAVADDGAWLVPARTTAPPPAFGAGGFNALLSPTGALSVGDVWPGSSDVISGFESADISSGGDVAAIVTLVDGAGVSSTHLMVNGASYVSTLDSLQSLGYSSASRLTRLFRVRVNESGSAAVLARVADPLVPGSAATTALLRFDAASAGGSSIVGERIADLATVLPGQLTLIEEFGSFSEPSLEINDAGQVSYTVRFRSGPGVPETSAAMVGQDAFITTLSPSPVPGRTWATPLWFPFFDLGASGTYVLKARLDEGDVSNNAVLVVDDEVIAREGESLPAFAPFVISGFFFDFNFDRVLIGDSRVPVWMTTWTDPDPSRGVGLFAGRELVLERGASMVDGRRVQSLYWGEFNASESGRYVLCRCRLESGLSDALVLGDLALGTAYCDPAQINSTGGAATAFAASASGIAGADVRITAGGLPSGSVALLVASTAQGFVGGPGGSQGDLCLGGQIYRLMGQLGPADASGATSTAVRTAGLLGPGVVPIVAGETWNFQYWYRDNNPGPTSNFSSAVSVPF